MWQLIVVILFLSGGFGMYEDNDETLRLFKSETDCKQHIGDEAKHVVEVIKANGWYDTVAEIQVVCEETDRRLK